jgi:hypothetical protein
MPVLSESMSHKHGASCSSLLYVAVGCAVLLLGVVMRIKITSSRAESQRSSYVSSSPPPTYSEKVAVPIQDLPLVHSHTHSLPPRPLSPHALPFTPPTLSTSPFLHEGRDEKLPSNEYYGSPIEMNASSLDSFETSVTLGEAGDEMDMPRRRSYTKTSSSGGSISGEILQVRKPILS